MAEAAGSAGCAPIVPGCPFAGVLRSAARALRNPPPLRRRLRLAGAIAILTAALAAEPAAGGEQPRAPAAGACGQRRPDDHGGLRPRRQPRRGVARRQRPLRRRGRRIHLGELLDRRLSPFAIAIGGLQRGRTPDLVSTGFAAGASVLLNDPAGGFEAAFDGRPAARRAESRPATSTATATWTSRSRGPPVVRVFRGDGDGAFAAGIDFRRRQRSRAAGRRRPRRERPRRPDRRQPHDRRGRRAARQVGAAHDRPRRARDLRRRRSPRDRGGPAAGPRHRPRRGWQAATSWSTARASRRSTATGSGGFGPPCWWPPGRSSTWRPGSFDGDAITDLAVGGATSRVARPRAGRPAAAIGRSFASGFSSGLNHVTTGDFNEDTQLDVVADATAGSRLLPGETLRVTPLVGFPTVRVNTAVERPSRS